MPSVHNPQSVSIGATNLVDVVSIAWSEQRRQIVGPLADGEVYHRIAEQGGAVVWGRIVFRNPAPAAAAAGQAGTLSATLKALGGGGDQTLTITGVTTGGSVNQVAYNRTAACEVPFLAASSDGTTSPVGLS